MEKKRDRHEMIFLTVILTLTPAFACMLATLASDMRISEFYLPNSGWKDEVFFYKMIEAISKYNQPLGYFGYAESFAQIGHLGSWSPFFLFFYVLYGKIFGWTLFSPFICNLIIMTIAMFLFAYFVCPNKIQTIEIIILYVCGFIFTRYIFSCMPEVPVYALALIFFGVSVKAFRQKDEDKKTSYLVALNLLACYLTLLHPYGVFLFFVPGAYWYQKCGKKQVKYAQFAIAVFSFILYFAVMKYFCAADFSDMFREYLFNRFSRDPMYIFVYLWQKLLASPGFIWQQIKYGLFNGTASGMQYLLFVVAICYFMIMCWQCKEKRKKKFFVFCLWYWFLALLGYTVFNEIEIGFRHISAFVFVFIFIVAIMDDHRIRKIGIALIFLGAICISRNDYDTYKIPVYTEEKASELQKGAQALQSAQILDFDTDNAWDNTVVFEYETLWGADFTYLYALPGGVGINSCYSSHVESFLSGLESRYLITKIDDEADHMCQKVKKERLAEYGDVHVWKLR